MNAWLHLLNIIFTRFIILFHVVVDSLFSLLYSIMLCKYSTVYLSLLQLIGILVVSNLGL